MQYEGGSSRSTVSRIRAWSVVVVFLVLVTVALLDRQAINFAIFGGASAFCFWRGREYATRSIALLRSVEPA
jgi:hypothetical protein